jgi:hypothetical protein
MREEDRLKRTSAKETHKDWHRKEPQVCSLERDVSLPHGSVECLQPRDEHSRVRDSSQTRNVLLCFFKLGNWAVLVETNLKFAI